MSDSSSNSWTLTNVPDILHNPERHQQRLLRRAKAKQKSIKKQRSSRSRIRSHRNRHRRSSSSRSKSISPYNVPNTATNWSNYDPENYNDLRHGPRELTVEVQLLRCITDTDGHTTKEVRHRIKAILDKIAHRPKGEGYYPKNILSVSTVDNAISCAVRNRDAGDHGIPMSIVILDTLLSHPLFKNVLVRYDYSTQDHYQPYDAVNEALRYAVQYTNDVRIIRYLVHDRGASPTANNFAALLTALRSEKIDIDNGRQPEKSDIVDYFMQHPFMKKWDTLHHAIEYVKVSKYPHTEQLYFITFFVYCMFPMIEDKSDKKTKEHIIVMHDHYHEYLQPPEKKEINRLYSAITQSLNKKLPAAVHNMLSTYG